MSAEHSSGIKTPKQLIVVILAGFLVPILGIVMLSQLVMTTSTVSKDDPAMSDEAVAKRIKPVGEIVVADPNAPKVLKFGEEIVKSVCSACHVPGVLNAPKIGDKVAWGKLVKQGLNYLVKSAINGKGAMPPRGGVSDLSDTEIARAIIYMANQSGGSVKELAAPTGPAPAKAAEASKPAPTASAPVQVAAAGNKGKSVYDSTCSICHATGLAGAPQTGDKTAWAPRLKPGKELLYASAIKGKNAMPPKGGNANLPEADVRAAVDYLIGQVK